MPLLIARDSDDETPESYHMAAAIYPHLINFSPTFEAGSIEILKRESESRVDLSLLHADREACQ